MCIAALLGITSAAPYFYLPSGVGYGFNGGVVPYSAPIHIVPPAAAPVSPPQKPLLRVVDVQEATQFHSQDGRGQFLFGYSIPDQARIESRTSDGTVRGSYSYLDPVGRAITVQYIADKSGYHAASNEVPVSAPGVTPVVTRGQNSELQYYAASAPTIVPASVLGNLPAPIADTPEVAAAREAHLRLHQAALEAHAAAVAEAEAKEAAGEGAQKVPAKEGTKVDFEEDVGEEVEVEEDEGETNSGAIRDESDEGVVIESEAMLDNAAGAGLSLYEDDHELTYEKDRYPKLQYTALPETYDPARVHDEENNAVIVTNPEFASEGDIVSTRTQVAGEEEKKPVESQATGEQAGKGAFFYSFRHAVPVFINVPQDQQHQIVPNPFLGVLGAPGVVRASPNSNQKPTQTLSLSERASLLGAIPVAAVHDAQVSPFQRGSIKDHQTLPLYIAPVEIEEN